MSVAVGLVGFGYAGRVLHAPLLRASGMQVVGVVSRQGAAVHALWPSARLCADIESLLVLPRLDLVVIATPNNLHEAQVLAALAAGKHVVVDKPMALTVASADRLEQAAEGSGLLLVPFHNRRWDSDFLTVQRVMGEGSLGRIHTFEAHWDRYRATVPDRWRERPEQGGGLLFDLGTHLIDQALTLFGMPEWLQADVYSQRPGAIVDDAFEIRMGREGFRVALGASSLAAMPRPRIRLVGELGCFIKEGIDPQEDQLRAGLMPSDAAFGLESWANWGRMVLGGSNEPSVVPSERGRWAGFYGAVRSCIESGAAPPVSACQARQVLRVIEAARLSSQSGERVALAAPDRDAIVGA